MLTHLLITNYALIDHLEIDFKKGLTIITGETGAGKSIILGALSLILGERADLKVIRKAENKSVIEASFNIEAYNDMEHFFEQNDIEFFDNECILRREIASNGRSRAFINDTPVTLSVLRELTLRLVDIHSQHSNMLLADALYQLSIIDSVSGNDSIKADYSKQFSQYKKLKVEIEKLKAEYEKNRQEEDYIQFQLDQIAALKLQENEDEELEREQSRLSNVNEIKQCLWSASSVLQDEDNSIVSQLSVLSRSFLQIENVDADLKELSERLQSLMIELKDFSRTISSIQDSYVDDPNELERINERLNNIYDLENKHKLSCVNELIALQHSYEEKLAVITNSDDEIKRLEEKLIIVEKEARAKAKELSLSRRKGAEIFKQELEKTAIPLGMKNLRFEIGFEDCELCAQGMDKVEFLFAFNKQQQLMPIENTASGGELSRVMLCIKAIIAQNMQLPTIIFDEVDTGVSGEIAHKMGEMMGDISNNIQVIAITHLPQVAVKGNNHLKVYKADTDEATYTSMCELTKEERVEEIARMLSGREIDAAAINNARSLLGY
ncbi:MAG: DNA repair protein RecN [Muribaculaceae bacterium]|jgi:DNA repair protein RecN (Recombination protein N)|nr:DNA repair protein RecN [Muribaculaceae bacterium]MEE1339134.1 DNA repair protein RecN [Muribaculaceae bacterium]